MAIEQSHSQALVRQKDNNSEVLNHEILPLTRRLVMNALIRRLLCSFIILEVLLGVVFAGLRSFLILCEILDLFYVIYFMHNCFTVLSNFNYFW